MVYWERCIYCGSIFTYSKGKHKYCGTTCRILHRREMWLETHTIITCLQCNTQKIVRKDHIEKYGWGKFCSKSCMLKNIKWSEESKRAWSQKQKGKTETLEHKRNISISMKKYIHTQEHNKHVSESKFGILRPNISRENHWNWLGGNSLKYPPEFNRNLRRQIRRESNHCCFKCGKTVKENGRQMNVHHIDYNKKNNNPENLVALCDYCHPITNYNRGFWKWFYSNYVISVREKNSSQR